MPERGAPDRGFQVEKRYCPFCGVVRWFEFRPSRATVPPVEVPPPRLGPYCTVCNHRH